MKEKDLKVHVVTNTRTYKDKTYKTHLLRRSYRKDGKVKKETIANLSHLSDEIITLIRSALKGEQPVPVNQVFEIVNSRHHGHVKAVNKAMKQLKFAQLIGSRGSREREVIIGLVAARILFPDSKLATIRRWETTTLPEIFKIPEVKEKEACKGMEWLYARQNQIEKKLIERHIKGQKVMLYDMSSSYFEGEECPLAEWGYNKDGKRGKKQVNYTLLCDKRGCPVGTRVYEGNYTESKTLLPMVRELKERYGVKEMVIVGDRGMIGKKEIAKFKEEEGIGWITALKAISIKKLIERGSLKVQEVKEKECVELKDEEYEEERLIGCCNKEVAKWKKEKRQKLIEATEKELEKIKTQVKRKSLRGKGEIGVKVGSIINKCKVGKYFELKITEARLGYKIREEKVKAETELDGIYVIITSLKKEKMEKEEVVRSYKELSHVERAFRSIKSVDLELRPIYHHIEERVRGHIFLCVLAYYIKWHMMKAWQELLFADEEENKKNTSPVGKAERSEKALKKIRTKNLEDGSKAHSFQTLLVELSTIVRNQCSYKGVKEGETGLVEVDTTTNKKQQRAYDLLEVIEM